MPKHRKKHQLRIPPLAGDEFRVLPFVTPFNRSKVGRNPFPPPSSEPGLAYTSLPAFLPRLHHPCSQRFTRSWGPSASPDRKPDTLVCPCTSSPSSRYGSLNCFSPVDPIKDYGETIVACANIPLVPPFLHLFRPVFLLLLLLLLLLSLSFTLCIGCPFLYRHGFLLAQ